MPKISSQKVFACPSTMLDGSTLRIYEECLIKKREEKMVSSLKKDFKKNY